MIKPLYILKREKTIPIPLNNIQVGDYVDFIKRIEIKTKEDTKFLFGGIVEHIQYDLNNPLFSRFSIQPVNKEIPKLKILGSVINFIIRDGIQIFIKENSYERD